MKGDELFAPWQDQVKGSWWKAPLVILGYFYLRLVGELRVIGMGLQQLGLKLSPTFDINQDQVSKLVQIIEWPYFLLSLALTLVVIAACYFLGFRFLDLKSLTVKNIMKVIGIYLIGLLLQALLTSVIYTVSPDYTQPINQEIVELLINNMNKILIFINIVIITPIIEELILRGLIMKYTFSLMPVVGAGVASFVFAMLHSPENIIDFVIYFALSSILTAVYWYTRRLEYPIIVHILQNLVAFLMI